MMLSIGINSGLEDWAITSRFFTGVSISPTLNRIVVLPFPGAKICGAIREMVGGEFGRTFSATMPTLLRNKTAITANAGDGNPASSWNLVSEEFLISEKNNG